MKPLPRRQELDSSDLTIIKGWGYGLWSGLGAARPGVSWCPACSRDARSHPAAPPAVMITKT